MCGSASAFARSAATGFAIAKNDPVKLRNFLLRMPKGGDLHNHLTGTIYAESYLGWAAEDGKCWDIADKAIVSGPCVEGMISFADVYQIWFIVVKIQRPEIYIIKPILLRKILKVYLCI